MAKIVLNGFSGMAPRYADYLLEQSQGSFAANLKATNGALRGFRSTTPVVSFAPTVIVYRRAIKLYYPGSDNHEWFKSTDVEASALQSPLTNDAQNRVYFTDSNYTRPQITTLAKLAAGLPSRDLGTLRPVTAPSVVHSAPSGGAVVRAYTYVWVSDYGEVSAPAPATLVTGTAGGTWTITTPAIAPANTSWVDIYRSSAGLASGGAYYKVARLTVTAGNAGYDDGMAADIVPLQPQLTSLDNDRPPAGLKGLVQHSSGAFAGFIGKDVYFSIPYLPHAWPGVTKYSVQWEISALASISNSIIAITKGFPVALTGTRPDGMSLTNMVDAEPCLSPRSVVVSNNTVLYASPNGLAAIGASGNERPINELVTREEWPRFSPSTMVAGIYGSFYIAFSDESNGIAIALPPYEPESLVVLDRYSNVTGVELDRRSADLYLVTSDRVAKFDDRPDTRFPTTWRSKEFVLPKPINFGAFQVLNSTTRDADMLLLAITQLRLYNQTRFGQGPLDVLNLHPLGGMLSPAPPIATPSLWDGVPPRQSLGGSPLYDIDAILLGRGTRVTLIADDAIIYTRVISDQLVHKLPSGFKATKWYIELSGSAEVQRFVLAETARECREG